MSDEPNKLAEDAVTQPDSPAVAEQLPAPPVEEVVEEAAIETGEASPEAEQAQRPEVEAVVQEPVEEEETEKAAAIEQPQQQVEEPLPETEEAPSMDWYILKVQSNREKSIAAALKRKIAVEGLDEYFGDVVVPMEKVTEFKGGKKKIVERKLYPGYIVVHMHINDDTWFAVRETSGIGDFTGSGGKPTPMLPHEVARIIQTEEEVEEEAPKLNISFKLGDRVKVKEGTFESFEGEVSSIDEQSGRITVMINIFGRSTPVELEYWQAEQV
ncbi:MAG: transcription termination/antitermination protein NusG [Pirellulales bacterium]|nr:transcription termination/antitermination protein NusG [Pirellulales bacterium]